MTFPINEAVKNNVKMLHQSYASAIISLTILIAAFWTMYISPILVKFDSNQMEFNITSTERAWIVSIMDFGNFLSAIPAGMAMDKYGRKSTLLMSAAMYLMASLFAIFATAGRHLFVARLLAGFGKGYSFTVAPIYVSEISSASIRGTLCSTFYGFFCAGVIVASVGPYVSFQEFNAIGLGLTLAFTFLMLPIPESMYYYIMKDKPLKAEKAIRWFRHTDTDNQMFQTEDELAQIKVELEMKSGQKARYRELLTNKPIRKAFLIVSLAGMAQRVGGISYMLSYGISDLPHSGAPFNREACIVVFSVVSLIANIVSGLLVDRIGRKPIFLFSLIITSISTFIGGEYFVAHHEHEDRYTYWIPYTVVIVFSYAFTAGLGVIPATFQGELFPPRIKRQASAVVVMIASVASFFVNFTHDAITSSYGVSINYFVPAVSTFCFAIWAELYVFETKGKTLLEIQNQLTGP